LDPARVEVKGGRAFGSVEGGDASAGAGAYVDEAPVLGERGGDPVDGLCDFRERASDGGGDLGVFSIDDSRDFQGGFAIEIGGGGVRFLGPEAAEV
jgi:hypothetical protein